MKLVLVCEKMHTILGGEGFFFQNLVNGLTDNGINAELVQRTKPVPNISEYTKILRYSRIPTLMKTHRLLKDVKEYDILHFLNSADCLAGLGKKGVKIATSHVLGKSHYLNYTPPSFSHRFVEKLFAIYSSSLDRTALNDMDIVVASSGFHARDIHDTFHVPDSKLRIIPPGVDVSHIRKIKRIDLKSEYGCENIILFIARLSGPRKGLQCLIQEAKNLKSTKIMVIGGGMDQEKYAELVRTEGLEDMVVFLGNLDFERKTAIQKSVDAVVIPSLAESFSMVFAESLACEVPVVAYDMPFWKGLYDGAALFVPRDSLASGINRVLGDEKLRKELISNGKSLAEKYDCRKTVSDYIRLYESLI